MDNPQIEKKLFLLDAYALIFRAYYAFIKNPRFSSTGLNTSAILGFANTLFEVLQKEKPSHIAVVFDPPAPNFRKKLFPDYKAHRKPTPNEIIQSVPYIKKMIEGFNIPVIEVEGFEADDTIGTLAKKAEKEGFTVYLMTPDKDYIQLLSDNIFMFKPKRGKIGVEIVSEKTAIEKYKIKSAKQFIDILAIWGDTADNIPGIPGIGEKTAAKLISRYGSIQGIYNNLTLIKGKQKENIIKSREAVKLSEKLVTIVLDVPVEFNAENCKYTTPNYDELSSLFKELEFNALAKRIIPTKNPDGTREQPENVTSGTTVFSTIKNTEHNYIFVDTKEKRERLINKLSTLEEFCFDTETTSTEAVDAELVGIAFSYRKHEAYYVPVPENEDAAFFLIEEFKEVLENNKITKIGQNIKYDITVLANYDIFVKGKLFDTMLAHYLLAPEQRHNLTKLSETYLNYTPVPIEELIGKKGKDQLTMRFVDELKIKEYAGEDADLTLQLKHILIKELEKNNLTKLAENIEFPLVYVLSDMERNGVKINTEKLNNYGKDLEKQIAGIKAKIYEYSGEEFNIASPKQLGEILFDKLKITDKAKRTKTGQYSTAEDILQKLKSKHDIIIQILKYRSLSKLLSTYVLALPKLVKIKTGKIHTSYNQAVTATGRLSSTNPNLQNIPIRTPEGRKIREAFIASDQNHILLAADYSQVELRIMAHLSKDKGMLEAFNNKEDIHSATAAKIYKIPLEEVTKEMRNNAKSANFGIIYGISAFGLSENLEISRSEAQKLIDGYFESYPEVKTYMDKSIKLTHDNSYAETLLGRKRMLYGINSERAVERSNAERNAINAPIQGTAADIIKIAMINCFNKINEKNLSSKMILQVHDELVFDVQKDELETVKQIVISEMENAYKLLVPLVVDTGTGEDWLQAH